MPSLFSAEDKARIQAAVAAAEAETEGELVVVVSRRADDYAELRGVFALAFMTLVGYALHHLVPAFSERWLLGAMGFLALFGYALSGAPPLLRLLVPASVRAARVDAHAKRVFVEEGVMETRERSGVLIYLAEAEHRVEILADAGIHARVAQGLWDGEVRAIVASVRRGEAAEGLIASIGRIGEALVEQFPRRGPRENQLEEELRER
jgi:putative membrane protein